MEKENCRQQPEENIHYEECNQCNGCGYFINTKTNEKEKCSQCDGNGYIEIIIEE